MSTFTDPFISEAEALSQNLITEGEARLNSATARLAACDMRIKKVEAIHHNDQERFHKDELALEKHKVSIIAPHILAAYEKLPNIELKLRVAAYEHQRKTDESKRLQAKHIDTIKSEICLKKSNKQLTQTVESLAAKLDGKVLPQEQALKNESQELRKELDLLRAQLASKTEELEAKDAMIMSKQQDIDYLREDFDAYQSVYETIWSHRHDGCNELTAALEEQCGMVIAERNVLEANLNALDHKCTSLAMERDYLQKQFDESIKVHKLELEDLNISKCEDSQGCTSYVVHLGCALRIALTGEIQALQLVYQVNHDRMVAWDQLDNYQTRVVQEHYASVGAWVAARKEDSVSPTRVSPDFKHSEGSEDGWKIADNCVAFESSSIEFPL